jgi:hypothetical protein
VSSSSDREYWNMSSLDLDLFYINLPLTACIMTVLFKACTQLVFLLHALL